MLYIKQFVFSPIAENTYVLYNDKGRACIIDPGCYHKYEQQQLSGFLKKEGLEPVLLLNTHCHLDHVFGLDWVAATYNLTPHIHPDELQMLKLAPLNGDMWNLPFKGYTGPANFLQEGQAVDFDGEKLSVILAPGHSPGHVCFYYKDEVRYGDRRFSGGILIGGDVLFKQSIGRTDLPGGNLETLLHNIRTKLFTLPGDTTVFPGHGDFTTIGEEQMSNPYL